MTVFHLIREEFLDLSLALRGGQRLRPIRGRQRNRQRSLWEGVLAIKDKEVEKMCQTDDENPKFLLYVDVVVL